MHRGDFFSHKKDCDLSDGLKIGFKNWDKELQNTKNLDYMGTILKSHPPSKFPRGVKLEPNLKSQILTDFVEKEFQYTNKSGIYENYIKKVNLYQNFHEILNCTLRS